jgi:AbrB family looped-hinge helix DNA binding protein
MKVGENGQVTIPKDVMDQAGLGPNTEIEIDVEVDRVVLRKSRRPLPPGLTLENLRHWQSTCQKEFAAMGYTSVDEIIEDVRGR